MDGPAALVGLRKGDRLLGLIGSPFMGRLVPPRRSALVKAHGLGTFRDCSGESLAHVSERYSDFNAPT